MTRAFIWHQKVKIANLQLSNVMLKDREMSLQLELIEKNQTFQIFGSNLDII